jgi:hypothetical protein
MTSCFETMLFDILLKGVNTNAYIAFVESTIQQIRPSDNKIGTTFSNILTSVTSTIAFVVLVIILTAFIILILLLLLSDHISILYAICAIIVAIALTFLYVVLVKTYSSFNANTSALIQDSLVRSAGYTANSVLRNLIYLALCR